MEIFRANRELRESNQKFNQLADNITDAFWIRSPDLREIYYLSPAFERIWGRSTESVYANPGEWAEFIVPEDRQRVLAAFAALTDDTPSLDIEYRIMKPSGETRWVGVRGFQVRDAATQSIRHIGIDTDITGRKWMDAELEKAHKELVETSRKAGMAEMATGVLHNVGNVLNSVSVASSCLARSLQKSTAADLSRVVALLREHESDLGVFLSSDPKGKKVPDYLAKLAEHMAGEKESALKELAQLQVNIEHIKVVVTSQQSSAKTAGKAEKIQVTDLVEQTLQMDLDGQASRDIMVVKQFEPVPAIIVEKHKLLQILMNLVRNAKQACQEAGGQEKRLTLRVTEGDGRVRIAVSDNGAGISPENLANIFTHGFTTKKAGHGFGLHSAIMAAKELGGSLAVQSAGRGCGATFTLELPLAKDFHQELKAA
jgi:PAS domain S-box-containing protein